MEDTIKANAEKEAILLWPTIAASVEVDLTVQVVIPNKQSNTAIGLVRAVATNLNAKRKLAGLQQLLRALHHHLKRQITLEARSPLSEHLLRVNGQSQIHRQERNKRCMANSKIKRGSPQALTILVELKIILIKNLLRQFKMVNAFCTSRTSHKLYLTVTNLGIIKERNVLGTEKMLNEQIEVGMPLEANGTHLNHA